MSTHNKIASFIAVLFVVVAILYALSTPIFEASDELHHYPVVAHLAEGKELPIQDPEVETFWQQEGSQPPLYYALSALLTSWIDLSDMPLLLYKNPHSLIGVPLAQENKNMIVHTTAESFPWQQTTLSVYIIRLFSILLGTITIFCTYRLGLSLFPAQPALALSAMALNAFIPMFLFISASVNNDNLVVALSSITLVLLNRLLQLGPSRRLLLLLGVIIGLACLTKLSALGLIPLTALALLLYHFQQVHASTASPNEQLRRLLSLQSLGQLTQRVTLDCITFFVPTVLIAGWWYLRNWRLYEDILGLNRMLDIAGRRSEAVTFSTLLGEFEGFRINFWGLFGGVNILIQPTWIYQALDGLTLVAFVGLFVWAFYHWSLLDYAKRALLFLLTCWLLIEILALFRWTSLTYASQGRLIFPALSAISILLTIGLLGWLPAKIRHYTATALVSLMFLLALITPFTSIQPAYPKPLLIQETNIPETAQRYGGTYEDVMRLLAFDIPQRSVYIGDSLPITLYWQSLREMNQDFSIFIQLSTQDGQILGQRDTYPGGGAYPTRLWSAGQIVQDRFNVPIRTNIEGPTVVWVEVGFYELDDMENQNRLSAADVDGNPLERTMLKQVKVVAPTQAPQPEFIVEANFENRARLLGYDLDPSLIRSNAELPITLYWEVLDALSIDYTIFIHLINAQGELQGQGDGLPQSGRYPTSFWGKGEMIADIHQLIVADGEPLDSYQIIVGLYDMKTGQRLLVIGEEGDLIGDNIPLIKAAEHSQ